MVALKAQALLILMKYDLAIFFFLFLVLFGVRSKNLLPNSKSLKNQFKAYVLKYIHLSLRSILSYLHRYHEYVVIWIEDGVHFTRMWLSSCHKIFLTLFPSLFRYPCWKSLGHKCDGLVLSLNSIPLIYTIFIALAPGNYCRFGVNLFVVIYIKIWDINHFEVYI